MFALTDAAEDAVEALLPPLPEDPESAPRSGAAHPARNTSEIAHINHLTDWFKGHLRNKC